jgi:DNA repair exonuclease SbcCD ATPase subunit
LDHLHELVEAGARDEAGARLVETEQRVAQFESDWKGLQGLLAQIESLRSEAADLKIPLGEIASELEGIKDKLAEPDLTEDALDGVAQEAAQTLMLLHEAIPTSLEEELTRHETTLNRYPDDHEPSAVARRLHVEATRHLKKGRLSEAVASVRDLRRQLELLKEETGPAPTPSAASAPAAPGTPETEAEMLDRLLKKARSLAARVRTLPADSDTARDAAIQIREATDLLRERHLKDADVTLTRLMRMLAYEAPRS